MTTHLSQLDIPPGLARGDSMRVRQQLNGFGHRSPGLQQLDGHIDSLRDLIAPRSPSHAVKILPQVSSRSPIPIPSLDVQLDFKRKIAFCVGGVLSPLLANIALSVLDEHFTDKWKALGPDWTRAKRRRAGEPTMRLVRYADDFVVLVHGTRGHAEALRGEVDSVLAPMDLRLSDEKTRVCHINEGFDFLGWRIQRRNWRGRNGKMAIYTYPSKRALGSIIGKTRALTRREQHRTLADLLRRLNPVLRGWCNYFRHGVSSRTFSYVDHFAFWRIVAWLRKRHVGLNMHTLVRRHLPHWRIHDAGIEMFRPNRVTIERYRYRGAKIPTPWESAIA